MAQRKAKLFRQLSHAKRSLLVRHGARYMDKHYPGWAARIAATFKHGMLNLANINHCIIGAGTGHTWSIEESGALATFVTKPTRIWCPDLTADTDFEPYWLVEAFSRVKKADY